LAEAAWRAWRFNLSSFCLAPWRLGVTTLMRLRSCGTTRGRAASGKGDKRCLPQRLRNLWATHEWRNSAVLPPRGGACLRLGKCARLEPTGEPPCSAVLSRSPRSRSPPSR
jgi:hypothetical protein